MDEDVLIVIPTLNEAENLVELLEGIRAHVPGASVLIVDDGSPDGTAALARELGTRLGHIDVLERPRPLGLGGAYVEGFRRRLAPGYRRQASVVAAPAHASRDLPALVRN